MKAVQDTQATINSFNIVIAGSAALALGAYKAIYRQYSRLIESGFMRLIVITTHKFHYYDGYLCETILGAVAEQDVKIPVLAAFPGAEVIFGSILENEPETGRLKIQRTDNSVFTLSYMHLINDESNASTPISTGANHLALNGVKEAVFLHQQLNILTDNAARTPDRFQAARILRVTVAADSRTGIETALAVAAHLNRLCREYCFVNVRPTVYLLLTTGDLYEMAGCSRRIERFLREQFYRQGIRLITGKKMMRVSTDGALLSDGSFISCSLVADAQLIENQQPARDADIYGKTAKRNNWGASGSMRSGTEGYLAALQQGKVIGKNLAAIIEALPLRKQTPAGKQMLIAAGVTKACGVFMSFPLAGFLLFIVRHCALQAKTAPRARTAIFRGTIRYWRALLRKPKPIISSEALSKFISQPAIAHAS